jgi:hypothetical protein
VIDFLLIRTALVKVVVDLDFFSDFPLSFVFIGLFDLIDSFLEVNVVEFCCNSEFVGLRKFLAGIIVVDGKASCVGG